MWEKNFNIFFRQFKENYFGSQDTFIRPVFFFENRFYSFNYISTMLLSYTQMKMTHLSQPQPNLSSIKEGCDSLGKTFLTSLVGNQWASGGLWVNSSPVKGGLISFPLFLLEENEILPITSTANHNNNKKL